MCAVLVVVVSAVPVRGKEPIDNDLDAMSSNIDRPPLLRDGIVADDLA